MSNAEEQQGISEAVAEDTGTRSIIDSFSVTGFSAICAWHFLVLFSSLSSMTPNVASGRAFPYQLALYLALAFSYLVMTLFSRKLDMAFSVREVVRWHRVNAGVGVFAALATAFMLLARGCGFAVELSSWIVLGISEAALMMPWLELSNVQRKNASPYRSFAFNMGIGAVIAFVVGNLFAPYGSIVFCILPLASLAVPVGIEQPGIQDQLQGKAPTEDRAEEEGASTGEAVDDDAPAKSVAKSSGMGFSRWFRLNANFISCGVVFGICQAVFSATAGSPDLITYDAGSSWPIAGALVSSFMVIILRPSASRATTRETVQRFSSLVFTAGIMASFYFITSKQLLDPMTYTVGDIVGQMLTLAGFNSFDFGFMVLAFSGAGLMEKNRTEFIAMNRCSIYLSMGAGLFIGWLVEPILASVLPNHTSAIVAVLVILLGASTMGIKDRAASEAEPAPAEETREPDAPAEDQASESEAELARLQRMNEIEDICHLSNRERQVFAMLADGKTANEIQQELWISIHTVKTHISNVYHKLAIHSARELVALVESDSDLEELKEKANAMQK